MIMREDDMSSPVPPPHSPSLPWRISSSLIMGLTGTLSRGFLYGLNYTEVIGLDRFLEILDKRKDVDGRERGLLTGEGIVCAQWTIPLLIGLVNSIKSCQRVCNAFPCH